MGEKEECDDAAKDAEERADPVTTNWEVIKTLEKGLGEATKIIAGLKQELQSAHWELSQQPEPLQQPVGQQLGNSFSGRCSSLFHK